MALKRQAGSKRAQVKIEGALSAYEVSALREKLMEGLETNNELFLDLNGVTDCDTAGLQLLCSAHLTAKSMGKRVVVEGAAPTVIATLERAGINAKDLPGVG
jgi:anti-anti-sigma factor